MSFVQSFWGVERAERLGVAGGVSKDNKNKPILDQVAGSGTSDKIVGMTKEVVGRAKRAVGDATDNTRLKSEGISEELEGKGLQIVGGGKEIAEDVSDGVSERIERVKSAIERVQKRSR